ncbi:MAG: hypothetical protein Q7T36_06195 [Fluviicoccus sp.]|uniref:beta strand repeat-containing protein n=1 Tax=Fluviicoccus sp. TaxID=2003552 RepID=UPI002718240F|nr:hypothetical protein [Fluviicoccus sp.]MDO8330044.1 hypothetical protein [Fluviicoccus sp.]
MRLISQRAAMMLWAWFTFLLCPALVQAGGVRIIQNPSFEIRADGSPVSFPPNAGLNNNTTWAYWGDSTCGFGNTYGCIAGWRTTDAKNGTGGQPAYNGPYIEVGYASTYGISGQDANRIVAELNATQQSRLWQPVCLSAGEPVTMTYYFSPRTNGGSLPQQVAAGLWNLNDAGPIGGALSYQNSNPASVGIFLPQIAYFTAPATGNFQLGMEALLPATGSNGNLIDDVKVILKPLIDMNTNPNFTIPEGGAGPAIQLRINGTVQTDTVVAIRLISGTATPDTDFSLGTPVGLAGTTPTLNHTPGDTLWLVTVPAGEYDAGQGIYGSTKYGVSIPINATYDTLREGLEDIVFQLQAPSDYGSDPVEKWDRTNPICEGATTNSITYDIDEIEPKIRIHKVVVGRLSANDQFVTQVKNASAAVVSTTSASSTLGGGVATSGAGLSFNAPGYFQANFNETYTLTEAMLPGSVNALGAYTSSIACTNARVIGPPTVLPSGAGQSFSVTVVDGDDITCTITNAPMPQINNVVKVLGSTRSAVGDQFTLQIKDLLGNVVNSTANSTTAGAGAAITAGTGETGLTVLQPGVTYTLTEIGAGSPTAILNDYNTVIACANANTTSTVLPSGQGQSFTLTPQGNDQISCTFTNIAHEPRVTLVKALNSSGRFAATDQFTMEIRRTSDNVLMNATTNSTTAGSGSTITAGSGTTDPVFLQAGIAYTLREVGAGAPAANLSDYSSVISCTNARSGFPTTTLPSGSGTSFSLTPNTDDVIVCTLKNARPRIRLNKTVTGLRDAADRFTTQIRTGGAGGAVQSGTTASASIGGGVLTTGGAATYTAPGYYQGVVSTAYTLNETVTAGSSTTANYLTSISCTNANTGSSTVLPSGSGTAFSLTPLSMDDDIDCTLTNTPRATLTLVKTLAANRTVNTDQFTVQVINNTTSTTEATATTGGTGTTVTTGTATTTTATPGHSYILQEIAAGTTTLANYYASYSCTNATGGSPTVMPSGFGTSMNITPAAGDNITCTLSNRPGGRIKVNKVVTNLVDNNDRFTTFIRSTATGLPMVSSTSSDTRTGGGVLTTGGAATYTAPGTYTGIAGTTYRIDELISAGTSGVDQYTTSISCTTTGGSTVPTSGSTTQPFSVTLVAGDLVTCTLTNTRKPPQIRLSKTVAGLINTLDRFRTRIVDAGTLAVVSDGVSANGTVITTVSGTGPFPDTLNPSGAYTPTAGTKYTLTEVMDSGPTPLTAYSAFINCTNTRSSGPVTLLPTGAGQSHDVTPLYGDNISCTLTNGPARLRVTKALANARRADSDEFTVQIKNSGGTVLNSTTSSTSAGDGSTVIPGTGDTQDTYVAGGSTYTLTEIAASGSLNNYESKLVCTNSVVSGTSLPSTAFTANNNTTPLTWTITPVTGDDIDCVLSNRHVAPVAVLEKALSGAGRHVDTDQFTVEIRNGGTLVNSATNATSQGTGATTLGGKGTTGATVLATGTAYTFREVVAGTTTLTDYATTTVCSRTDGSTGVITTQSYSGNTFTLSPNPANYEYVSCVMTNAPLPRIRINKTLVSKVAAGDTFTTQVKNGASVVSGITTDVRTGGGVSATTTGTTTTTGYYQGVAGTAYTLTEAISGSSTTLSQYESSISCTNTDTASATVLPSGSGQSFSLTPANGDRIVCTLTNNPKPLLRINKVVTTAANVADRFTTQIRTGGAGGTVVSDTSSSTVTGGGMLTTSATGTFNTAGAWQATAGTTYTLTEILSAGPSSLTQYDTTISCSNANGSSTTILPQPADSAPYNITVQDGDNITCSFTNTAKVPKIRVHKVVSSLVDANDRFTTEVRTGGVAGTVVSGTSGSATTGGGIFTTGGAGTYSAPGIYAGVAGTAYTVTESLTGGTSAASQYDTSISCSNALAGSATVLPSGSITPFTFTPQAGDDISCTLTNAVKAPVITVRKDVVVRIDSADQFTLGLNGGAVSQSATTTGVVAGVQPVTISNITLVAGTPYTLSEIKASGATLLNLYQTEMICSNARTTGPVTTLPTALALMTPSGAPLTSSYVVTPLAGDILTCTFTNSKNLPKLRVHKTVSSLVDTNDRFTTELRTGGAAGTVVSDTTASTTLGGGVLTTGGVATYNASGTYLGTEGIAYTLTESISGGTSSTQQYNTTVTCTNAYAGSATVMPTSAPVPYTLTPQLADDISCTLTNTVKQPLVRVHKTVTALVDVNDRFTTQVRTGGVAGTVVSSTTGNATTGGGVLTTGGAATYSATGSYEAAIGTTYTLTEALSGGTSLANQYATSLSCANARTTGPATTLPSGSAQPFDVVPKAGDDISCTLTNTPIAPLIRVNKTVTSIVDAADRFTTQIRTGGAGGTVVSDTTASGTTGGGVLTTGGVATYSAPGSNQAVAGTTYTLTEALTAGPSTLGQYDTTVSCTNSRAGATTTLPTGATQPFSVTPAAGDDITCTVSNAIRQPTVIITKMATGSTGSFSFANVNLATTPVVVNTTVDGTPVSSSVVTVTTRGADVTITETSPSNWTLTAAGCTDANSAATGNSGSFGTLAGNQLTIPGVNVVAGADIRCTFTNRKSATFTLRKSWVNAKLNDAVTVTTAGATNNASLNSVADTATEIDAATSLTFFAGETVTFSESFTTGDSANYTATLACTGATDTNLLDGLTVDAADSAIVCTQTNSRIAKTVTLRKSWVNAKLGDAVDVTATGLTALSSAADTATEIDAGSAQTVYAGDVITLDETFTTGNDANYNSSVACTGTTGLSGNTLTVGATDTPITCTQTNSRIAKTVTLRKSWVNAKLGDAVDVTATGLTTLSSAADTATEIDAGSAQTVYAGDVITLGETFTTGSDTNYNSSVACTGTTGLSGNTLTVGATDTPITCTQTNSRIAKTVTLRKSWVNAKLNDAVDVTATGLTALSSVANTATETDAAIAQTVYAGDVLTLGETFTTGSAANYNSSVACTGTTGLSGNTLTVAATDTPITCTHTNSRIAVTLTLAKTWVAGISGDTATVSSTGFTNNATSGASVSTGNNTTTGATVTVYAGDSGSISETFSVGLASRYTPVLACSGATDADPSDGLSIDPADTAINCTLTNRRLPTVTLTKVSLGGVRTFSFTGSNGFTAQNITTVSSGVGVSGATQYLTAASAPTVLTESLPAGYNLTSVSCTGLGAGGVATPNLLAGTVSLDAAATAAGADIACTFTNTLAIRLTVKKISQVRTGAFTFSGTNGYPGEVLTTITTGSEVTGVVHTLTAPGVATGITETLPSGWSLGSAICLDRNAAVTGNNAPMGVLAGSTLTIPGVNIVAGADLVCTFINTYTGFTITGRVFLDNGTGGGTAHNGTQQGGEAGLANAEVRLTDCGGTEYQRVTTNGPGDYTLTIPDSLGVGAPLCVEEGANPTLVSVSGVPGTTGGSYSLAQDRSSFALTLLTNYTGVNFGNVPESTLTGVGVQSTAPGTTVEYAHVFTAGTVGAVTFSTAQNPSPANPEWSSQLHRDLNCNGAVDPGDVPITAAVSVTAGQAVCLVQKVLVPLSTGSGNFDISTVSAGFAFTAPSVIVRPYSQDDRTTVITNGLGLVLVKEVRQVGSCPSTGADSNVFGTANDAPPGGYLEYRIRYTNQSQGLVKDVSISDATPAFTVFRNASCTVTPASVLCQVPSSGSGTAPSIGGSGTIDWLFTNNPSGLLGGQSGEVRFCVQLEQ